MRATIFLAAFGATLLAAGAADAHFHLDQPTDWLVTDALGDPDGGTQKMNPCGAGQASGAVTKVLMGSTLHIKVTETVAHGGHYRAAYISKLNPTTTDLPEPTVTYDSSGACQSAKIENPVVAPVIADNLFPHTQAQAVAGTVYQTDVTLPNTPGTGTLQVIEFMAPHAAPCFYHHCAVLQLVATPGELDGGSTTQDSGAGGGGGDDAGSSTGGGTGDDAATGTGGGTDPGAGGTEGDQNLQSGKGGCSSTGGDAPLSPLALAAIGLAVAGSLARRRRSAKRP